MELPLLQQRLNSQPQPSFWQVLDTAKSDSQSSAFCKSWRGCKNVQTIVLVGAIMRRNTLSSSEQGTLVFVRTSSLVKLIYQLASYSAVSVTMEFDLRGASLGTIIGAGAPSAVLHVLRRPDHLSVIALLSIGGSSWRSCRLGLAWGLAYSVGIAIMASIFSSTSNDAHFRTMSEHWNLTLALLLLLLGFWGLHHYLVIRKIVLQRLYLQRVAERHALSVMWPLATIPEDPCSGRASSDFEMDTSRSNIAVLYHPSFDEELLTPKCCCGRCRRPSLDMTVPATQTATAAVFGFFQGLGVAGCVFPASRLEHNADLAAFLVPLCTTSILLVSGFAALFGGLTSRLARVSDSALYRMGLGSSGLCIFIAMAWVALVAAHKMTPVVG